MSARTARETLEAFFAAFHIQDMTTMEALLAPDFAIYEAEGLPYAGVYRGIEGWRDLLGRIGAIWSTMIPVVRHFIGDGCHFAVLMDVTLVSVATGRTLETSVFELWTVEDGKVKEIRPHYWDTAAVAAIVS